MRIKRRGGGRRNTLIDEFMFYFCKVFSLSLSFFLLAFYQRRLWLWLSKKDRKIYTKRLESESESELGTSIWHLAPWHMHEMAITILCIINEEEEKTKRTNKRNKVETVFHQSNTPTCLPTYKTLSSSTIHNAYVILQDLSICLFIYFIELLQLNIYSINQTTTQLNST